MKLGSINSEWLDLIINNPLERNRSLDKNAGGRRMTESEIHE